MQIFSNSPSTIPRSRIKLSYGSPTTTEVYLKVDRIIEHVKYAATLHDNATMLYKYTKQYWRVVEYGKGRLKHRSNCLTPCTFMEYKVISHMLSKIVMYFYRLQKQQKLIMRCGDLKD